ncbi:SDR family NAD(P)-dependent oxidoreductase [bacterium]|nr:SDR family NAD(P)-dependent oxidoreductase [bacterium]
MNRNALIIGNSDGIGLGITHALLERGWKAVGISKSPSVIENRNYSHYIEDVRQVSFQKTVRNILNDGAPDLCVYCAGIGELLDLENMQKEIDIFQVNLMGLIRTAVQVIPVMAERGQGHFIGLSSVADILLSPEAPGYHASKAGFSNYLESLGLALKQKGVYVTNIRFGFVDTKMAKGEIKPFMISVEKAVSHILKCIEKRPVRYTAPRIIVPLVNFRCFMMRLSLNCPVK